MLFRSDIFTHFMPKPFLDRLGELIPGHPVLGAFPRIKTLWDVDARLALLDEFDGLQQVLSLANPPIELIAPPDRTPQTVQTRRGRAQTNRQRAFATMRT